MPVLKRQEPYREFSVDFNYLEKGVVHHHSYQVAGFGMTKDRCEKEVTDIDSTSFNIQVFENVPMRPYGVLGKHGSNGAKRIAYLRDIMNEFGENPPEPLKEVFFSIVPCGEKTMIAMTAAMEILERSNPDIWKKIGHVLADR